MVRETRVSRRGVLTATGGLGLASMAGCTGIGNGNGNGNGNSDAEYDWVIGTSGEETGTHASAVAFSSVINENSDMINLSPRTTPGTTANPRLLDEGEIDVAQGTDINGWNANTGTAPLNDPPVSKTLCQAIPWMTIEVILLERVEAELGIETVQDINEDTPMSWGPPGASAFVIGELGFEIAGIENPADKYNLQNMELGDLPAALRSEQIDLAFSLTVNSDSLLGYVQEMDSTNELDIVSWDVTEEEVLSYDGPLSYADVSQELFSNEFSMDTFPGIVSVYTTYFEEETANEAVYEFVDILMERNEEVQGYHNSLKFYGPDFAQEWMVRNQNVPVHPGAQEWLEDNGLWEDDYPSLDDFEDTR